MSAFFLSDWRTVIHSGALKTPHQHIPRRRGLFGYQPHFLELLREQEKKKKRKKKKKEKEDYHIYHKS